GVDVFACTRQVRDALMELRELDTNLIAVLFWAGYRRGLVAPDRAAGAAGGRGWDPAPPPPAFVTNTFCFTGLPIHNFLVCGAAGTLLAALLAVIVLIARLTGHVAVSGYTALMIAIVLFGGITTFGLGVIGEYLWLGLQLGKQRPPFVVRAVEEYGKR